ncbi:unnamed protein product [Nezara viridula]|uniref:Uncharacterized protein n=1 Tax=Nezara viridula TaxID=85310 RepID=A0A9P0E2V7_NEZVI|nr:unnamed protein product [Nezara viridula]
MSKARTVKAPEETVRLPLVQTDDSFSKFTRQAIRSNYMDKSIEAKKKIRKRKTTYKRAKVLQASLVLPTLLEAKGESQEIPLNQCTGDQNAFRGSRRVLRVLGPYSRPQHMVPLQP